MFKLNPIVAVAAESICNMHNPDWRAAARWRALDGMYAVCGMWDHSKNLAAFTSRANPVPHAVPPIVPQQGIAGSRRRCCCP